MIQVDRTRVAVPAVLDGVDSKGEQERQKAAAFYADPAKFKKDGKFKNYDFEVYRDLEIKDRLNELFHGKCAYCESTYEATQPMDVEHYRPKGGYVVEEGGKKLLKQPGYWWLAADWDNLLPSCIDCNRRRTQRFEDGEEASLGKQNLFPLHEEGKRAEKPDAEAQERPLLLHPCRDDPAQVLEFTKQGVVRPHPEAGPFQQAMAKQSIEVYGLRRSGLVSVRGERRLKLLGHGKSAIKFFKRLRAAPGNELHRQDLADALCILLEYRRAEEPYCLMSRQFVDPLLVSMRETLEAELKAAALFDEQKDPAVQFVEAFAAGAEATGEEDLLADLALL